MAKHINITDDIKNKINDFLNGDDKYWKKQYNKVMNEMNNIIMNEINHIKTCVYCKRRFTEKLSLFRCNEELCEWCDDDRCNEELCEWCDDDWGFGQWFWEKYGEDRDDGIVLKYLKIQQVLDEEN